MTHARVYTYADDSVLLFSAKTQDTLKAHIAEDMANLVQYCNSNLIKINIKKTKVLPFGSQSTAIDNFSPSVNGELLEIVNEFKYLGYIIDSKMNFKAEAMRVYSRLQSCRYLLNRCKGYVSIDLLKLLFNCTALVHATYSSTMLLYIGKLQAKKLTKVMLNIGKAIHGCSDEKRSRYPKLAFILSADPAFHLWTSAQHHKSRFCSILV